jgi:hypothetical protein
MKDCAMSEPGLDASYPVLVTERNGQYTLRVKELMLVVRGRDLGPAYREIVERKRRIFQSAVTLDSLDEVPQPARPPALASALRFCSSWRSNRPTLVVGRDAFREPKVGVFL